MHLTVPCILYGCVMCMGWYGKCNCSMEFSTYLHYLIIALCIESEISQVNGNRTLMHKLYLENW